MRHYVTIAAVSCAVLLYEIAITRVLSVVLWYHFAFLSVSLALLGLGAPGIWFYLFRPRPGALPASLIAAGIAVPASVVAITKGLGALRARDVSPGQFTDTETMGFLSTDVLVVVVVLLVPMLCLGAAVCLLLLRADGRRIGLMYGADLLGATLGAALVVPLMHVVPTPELIAGAGLLPLLAVPLVSRRAGPAALGVAALLAASIFFSDAYELRYTKKYAEGDRVLFEKWTPTGRITIFPDVFHQDDAAAAFAWGFGENFTATSVEQLWLEQDGSAGTPITKWPGNLTDLSHLFFDVTSFGYQFRPPERVCVIGAGGGRDILTALRSGATSIDAVELNPHIIGVVTGMFAEYSGNPYGMPGVHAIENEGRSHLTRTNDHFDLIQISMVDSWAATAAGAYSLSENFLYTSEAMQRYLDRLTDDGIVSFSRWFLDRHLVETARLVLLAQDALRTSGVREPRDHLVVVTAQAVATVLISKRPVLPQEIARVDEICAERGFARVWPPKDRAPQFSMIHGLLNSGPGGAADMGLDLSPPRDDRPFFFQTVPVLGSLNRDLVARLSVNEQSVVLLRQLVLVVTGLTLALFFLPLLVRRGGRGRGFWTGSGFFAGIGIAFLMAETSWIHRYILYLGHPSYATTVVLAGVLLGAGAGSLTASRLSGALPRRLLFALPVAVAAVNALLNPIFENTLGAPFATRVVIGLALLLPPSFLMGLPFPLGMVRFGDANKPWFWAMNGAFSVLASVTSLALSMIAGYRVVGWVAAGVYVGVALLYARKGTVDA